MPRFLRIVVRCYSLRRIFAVMGYGGNDITYAQLASVLILRALRDIDDIDADRLHAVVSGGLGTGCNMRPADTPRVQWTAFQSFGRMTTLIQPSSLAWNALYASGPCSRPIRCVTRNDGSIFFDDQVHQRLKVTLDMGLTGLDRQRFPDDCTERCWHHSSREHARERKNAARSARKDCLLQGVRSLHRGKVRLKRLHHTTGAVALHADGLDHRVGAFPAIHRQDLLL